MSFDKVLTVTLPAIHDKPPFCFDVSEKYVMKCAPGRNSNFKRGK